MNNGIPSPYQKEDVITDEGYGRFSKSDITLLKNFKGNESLFKVLKKIFFQMELSEEEKIVADGQFKGNKDFFNVIQKVFLPSGEDIMLIGGTRWADRKYSDLLSIEVKPTVLARKDSIRFTELGIERLKNIVFGGDYKPLELVIDVGMQDNYDDVPPEQVKRKAVAFQDSMVFLDTQIAAITGLINKKEETATEREARLKKDSTK